MSVIDRAYKYRLLPTKEQEVFFQKSFGCCRKIWNLMLSDKIECYEKKNKYLKVTPAKYKSEYSYLKEVDSLALSNVQLDLENAYKSFFKNKSGFPKFKSKHKDKNSYTTNNQNGTIEIFEKHIKLPKVGKVKIKKHRNIPDDAKLKSATISQEKDGTYYVSCLVKIEVEDKKSTIIDKTKVLALDYKSDGLYMDSNNHYCDMPHFYRESEDKLRKEQRKLSKKKKHSNNFIKQKKKVAKLQRHIANQRKDFLQKESTKIANLYDLVAVETLNMNAIGNKKGYLGKATHDNGYGMFINMLDYKLSDRNKKLIKVDQYYPSSQICSKCGHKHKLKLHERTYKCQNCGTVIDRDYNAALNIKEEGIRIYDELVS